MARKFRPKHFNYRGFFISREWLGMFGNYKWIVYNPQGERIGWASSSDVAMEIVNNALDHKPTIWQRFINLIKRK